MVDFGEKDAEYHNKRSYYYRHPKCLRGGVPMGINGPAIFVERAPGNHNVYQAK